MTRHIAACAREKRLGEARETFRQLRDVEGLAPTAYTYSNLMNAHVASGDLAGATSYGSRGEVELLRELEIHAIPDEHEDDHEGTEAR